MNFKIPSKISLHLYGGRHLFNNNLPRKVNGIPVMILAEGMIDKMIDKDLEMVEDSAMNMISTTIVSTEAIGDSIAIEDSVMEEEEEAVDLAVEEEITMRVEVMTKPEMDLEGVVEEEVVVEEASDRKIIEAVREDKIEIEASILEINLATHHLVLEEIKIKDLVGEMCQIINSSLLLDGVLKDNQNKQIKHLNGAKTAK